MKGVEGVAEGEHGASAETLSAMMDDEAQELELRRLLRDYQDNGELRARWQRLHLARGAMHGEPVRELPGFAAAVRSAIDAEAPLPAGGAGTWRRALGSFAVAASVATVVVLGGQEMARSGSDPAGTGPRVAPLPVGVVNTVGAVPVQASFGTRALPALQPADHTAYRELARQRMRRYSQEHAAHASLNTPQGLVPFARVPVIEE